MAEQQPNILLIHADQHRRDCLGAYGNRDVKTPNIDQLAADGVTYQNHFCAYPVCTPSRYSLLTGLYTRQHLGWTNHSGIPGCFDTFPTLLKDSGYRTKAVGKMHFTPTYLDVGFEEMELAEQNGPGRYDDDYHRYLKERGLVDKIDMMDQVSACRERAPDWYWDNFGAVEADLAEEHHSTTWIGDRAVETLDAWSEQPQLLMVGFIKPHHPFDPPAPWSQMYNPDDLELLPGWTEDPFDKDLEISSGFFNHTDLTESRLRQAMAYYYATISHIDHQVGRMIEKLQEKGLYENTLIIYTSDHGDYMGHHHMLLKGNHMYDPLVRIPLIMKYPRGTDSGTNSSALCSNIDMAPTVLSLAGCSVPASMTGIDLTSTPQGRDQVFCESSGGEELMLRSQSRKLLFSKRNDEVQFYDLAQDPMELTDVSENPEYQNELQEYLQRLMHWGLFDALPPTYLNEYENILQQPNVRSLADNHREEMETYFMNRMEDSLDPHNQQLR